MPFLRLRLQIAFARFLLRFLLALLVSSLQPSLRAQEHLSHEMHAEMSRAGDATDSQELAKLLADKRESEFNHHLAGFFVLFAGLMILAEGSIRGRWRFASLAWPVCLLLTGLFVLIWSDSELWPIGTQSWYYGLTRHPEVLQHKIFAILLLILGAIEFQRTRGALKSTWSSWVFPVLGVIGAAMLFFHDHQAGMHGTNHMEIMQRIKAEHFSFALVGIGAALSKGLAETRFALRPFFERLFPALMIVLGVLLLLYVE